MLSDPVAQKAYTFMKAGVVKGLSIGYDTIQATYDGDIRHLTELRLWEISCVTFPMNRSGQVSGVKAISDDERADVPQKAINECRKGIARHTVGIQAHLKSMLDFDDADSEDDDDDTDDEPLLDGEDDGDDEKAFLVELRKLAEQAEALASA